MSTKKSLKDKDKKSVNEKSNLWFLVVPLIFILGLFLYGQLKDDFQEMRLDANGSITVGSVTDKGYTKGPDIILTYTINKKPYEKRSGSPCKIDIGEQFQIFYNVNDPSDAKILFSKPIIPDSFIQTKGKISRIDDGFFKRVQFTYSIHSGTFTKEQVIDDKQTVSLDQEVIVCYNEKAPEKSFIKW